MSQLPTTNQQYTNNVNEEWLHLLDATTAADLIPSKSAEQLRFEYLIGLLPDDALSGAVIQAIKLVAADRAIKALAEAFEQSDVVELRTLQDGGGSRSLHACIGTDQGQTALRAFIRDHIGRQNLYFGINPRKSHMNNQDRAAKSEDVAGRRMAVLDLDLKDAPSNDPGWKRTISMLHQRAAPSMILNSGNGFHVWLPLSGADSEKEAAQCTEILAQAMGALGADNMSDLPRVARIPYTINLPNAAKRARGATVRLALPEVAK